MNSQNTSKNVIKIHKLSKFFRVYDKPIDRVKNFFSFNSSKFYKEFKALDKITLTINKGDVVGLIGKNGSGKSTLLQIVSGILKPTSGFVKTYGRIAALLELGAGFNPLFSGIENIYLVGAIYGLQKKQIDQRLDEIIQFADIGDFIYQPVKNYSTGMYMRLAFSVIANIDADILIIDEAFVVGDLTFSQKCIRFISNFKKKGTILLVSHDMNSVLNLCTKTIWIDAGKIKKIGLPKDIVNIYHQFNLQLLYGKEIKLNTINNSKKEIINKKAGKSHRAKPAIFKVINNLSDANGWKTGHGEITFASIYHSNNLHNKSKKNENIFISGNEVSLNIQAKFFKKLSNPIIGFLVKNHLGQVLFGENTLESSSSLKSFEQGSGLDVTFKFDLPPLAKGDYSVTVSLADGNNTLSIQHHWLNDAILLKVVSFKNAHGLFELPLNDIIVKKSS